MTKGMNRLMALIGGGLVMLVPLLVTLLVYVANMNADLKVLSSKVASIEDKLDKH